MDSRHLELAAEFGQITGKRDLTEYLGLPPGATPTEAKAALRARRKKMQGMQANPKYRREAVFLIKYSAAFDALLSDLDAYRTATVASHDESQVPILEMAIRGALAGGGLSGEQRGHVHEMAKKLGISDATFESTLTRLTLERTGAAPAPLSETSPTQSLDMPLPSSAFAPTAPPVRTRTHGPGAPPPVPGFATSGQTLGLHEPKQAPQLEIIGDPIRYVELGKSPVVHEIRVRNRGSGSVPARVSVDAGWLVVSPKVLDPTKREQTISVRVDPAKVVNPPQSAVVHIVTEDSGRATVVFEAIAPPPHRTDRAVWIAGSVVAVLLVIVVILYTQGAFSLPPSSP